MEKKHGALFCGGIYRDIVAVASRFPGKYKYLNNHKLLQILQIDVFL